MATKRPRAGDTLSRARSPKRSRSDVHEDTGGPEGGDGQQRVASSATINTTTRVEGGAFASSYDRFFSTLRRPVEGEADVPQSASYVPPVTQGPAEGSVRASPLALSGRETLEGEVIMPGAGCVQRVLVRDDLLHMSGTDFSMVVRTSKIDQWFKFECVVENGCDRPALPDGVLLTASSVELLLSASRAWTREQLRAIGKAHGVLFTRRATKGDMVEGLTKGHCCGRNCTGILYAFACSRVERRVERQYKFRSAAPSRSAVGDQQHVQRMEENLRERYGPTSGGTTGSFEFPPPRSESLKYDIVREFQAHMHLDRWVWKACAVCGQKKFDRDLSTMSASEVPWDVLRNDDIASELWPTTYDFHLYHRALLCPDGMSDPFVLGDIAVCGGCRTALARGEQPADAIANYQYYAHDRLPTDVREAFGKLSMSELQLIAACGSTRISFVYTADPSSQRYTKGNVAIIPQDVTQLKRLLPPSRDEMQHLMCVLFIGSREKPTMQTLRKMQPVMVSKNRVELLINFLTTENEFYREQGMSFSKKNLETLCPDPSFPNGEGVPSSVEVCYMPHDSGVSMAATTGVSGTDRLNVDVPDGELLVEVAGSPSDHQSGMAHNTSKLDALQRCRQHKPFVAVHGGSQLFPDRDPRMLTFLFPHLDPWGLGGFNNPRRQGKQKLSFERQLRNLLMRYDLPQFQADANFAYVAWNIIQKLEASQSMNFRVGQNEYREMCREIEAYSAVFEKMNDRWKKDAHAQPSTSEEKKALRVLDKLKLLARNLRGSNGRRVQMRNEIRALLKSNGCPTLFMTINPADLQSKLLHVLAGGDAGFFAGMSHFERAKQVAGNPAAAAQFFDIMIKAFIEKILRHGDDRPGLFGVCDAYYGTVEAQGRGTLHCHMLVWIRGSLSPQALRDRLEGDTNYRQAVFSWLESVIKCELPDMDKLVQSTADNPVRKPETNKANDPRLWEGPTIPDNMTEDDRVDFERNFKEFVKELAVTCNWHEHTDTCWKHLRPGQTKDDAHCRMRMDGSTRALTELDAETSAILLRRLHPWINNFNEVVLFLMRCNMDIKFIGSGEAAKALVYYVTDYITKASLPTHLGLAALCAAIDKNCVKYQGCEDADTDKVRRSLLTKIVNAMMARQELSHAQVMSYLVGGGDYYTSHCFRPLYFGQFDRYILSRECEGAGVHTEQRVQQAFEQDPYGYATLTEDGNAGTASEPPTGTPHDDVTLTVSAKGVSMSSALLDYRYRGTSSSFENLSVWDHVSWVERLTKANENARNSHLHEGTRRHGACAAERVEYSGTEHPLFETHLSRLRRKPVVPVYLGKAVPTRDSRPEEYCRLMLILFKPWRVIEDLKTTDETWTAAFDRHRFPDHLHAVMTNMHVERECRDAKHDSMQLMRAGLLNGVPIVDQSLPNNRERDADDLESSLLVEQCMLDGSSVMEEDVHNETQADLNRVVAESNHISQCVDVLTRAGLVDASALSHRTSEELEDRQKRWNFGAEDVARMRSYMGEQKGKKRPQRRAQAPLPRGNKNPPPLPVVPPHTNVQTVASAAVVSTVGEATDVAMPDAEPEAILQSILVESGIEGNEEQEMALRTVAEHFMSGDPEQLLMYISGVGGTGKSHVVKAIVELFERCGSGPELLLSAPTGIAAVLIGGYTLHALAFMPERFFKKREHELVEIWKDVRYLIVDEVSMISPRFMYGLSRRLAKAKAWDTGHSDMPFGGINVIFCGDFGQLRPPLSKSLFARDFVSRSNNRKGESVENQEALQGAHIWRQVNTVVQLTKNWRHAKDRAYSEMVGRIREGKGLLARAGGKQSDYELLSGRVLNVLRSREDVTKFRDSPIITVDKKTRDALNVRVACTRAKEAGKTVSFYVSDDSHCSRQLEGDAARRVRLFPSNMTNDMLGFLPLFPGMPVMVTDNMDMMHRVVNGMEGTVQQVDYEQTDDGSRRAICAYVHVPHSGLRLDGLGEDIVPIFPMQTTIRYVGRSKRTYTISRRQLPLLPAYAYIDYKSQGRSLSSAIVDLASCKTQQSAYVMLSRVTSLEGLAILRWFPPAVIARGLEHDLRLELDRLQELAAKTRLIYHSKRQQNGVLFAHNNNDTTVMMNSP